MQPSFPITLSTEPALMARAHAFIYHFVTAEAGVQHLDSPYGNSEVCHPRCAFKLYGVVNSVKKRNYKIWLNDGVY